MSVLFGFYLLVATLFAPVVGLPIVVAGSVIFVGVQYVVGKKLALRSVDAEAMSTDERSEIHERVERLAEAMGIEKPTLMVGRMGVRTRSPSAGRAPERWSSRRRCLDSSTRATCRWTNSRACSPTNSHT